MTAWLPRDALVGRKEKVIENIQDLHLKDENFWKLNSVSFCHQESHSLSDGKVNAYLVSSYTSTNRKEIITIAGRVTMSELLESYCKILFFPPHLIYLPMILIFLNYYDCLYYKSTGASPKGLSVFELNSY